MPFWRDSATFSAACRHTEQDRNSASPSFHSLLWRSKVRGVEAIRKLATAAPEGVKRSSGSSTRLPTTVIWVSPAMSGILGGWVRVLAHRGGGARHWATAVQSPPRDREDQWASGRITLVRSTD